MEQTGTGDSVNIIVPPDNYLGICFYRFRYQYSSLFHILHDEGIRKERQAWLQIILYFLFSFNST